MAITNKGGIVTKVKYGVQSHGGPMILTLSVLILPDATTVPLVFTDVPAVMDALNYCQGLGMVDVVTGLMGVPMVVAFDDVLGTYTFVNLLKLAP